MVLDTWYLELYHSPMTPVNSVSLRITTGSLHSSSSRRSYPCRVVKTGRVRTAGNQQSSIEITPLALQTARDSTALTIIEIDLSTLSDDLIQAPRYLVRYRKLWTRARHRSTL
jgi:hypothetical protein